MTFVIRDKFTAKFLFFFLVVNFEEKLQFEMKKLRKKKNDISILKYLYISIVNFVNFVKLKIPKVL